MSTLKGRDLFYAHLTEYLDDTLKNELKAEMKNFGDSEEGLQVTEQFQKVRGWMQFELQKLYLSEDETLALRRLVGDKEERHNIEETNISEIGRQAFWGHLKRNIGFWGIGIGAVLIAFNFFNPVKKVKFNPLQYVEYESLEYENSDSNSMDFPSDSRAEVAAFFKASQKLKKRPEVLKSFGGGWKIEGASFIDYDTDVMAVVQYGKPSSDEKIFHYSYEGLLEDLPKTAIGDLGGFKYQTYASEKLNLVAWQHKEGLVYLLVGHRSAEDLAKFAKRGSIGKE